MKKVWLLLLFATVFMFAPQANADEGLSFWMLGDYNVAGFRFGYIWDSNPDVNEPSRFEIGGLSYWRPWETEDIPQTYGLYGLYHFPGEFDISQIPPLSPLAELLPSLSNYIGLQGAIEFYDDSDERGFFGPVVGTVLQKFIFDSVDDNITTGVEAQWVQYTDRLEEQIDDNEFRVSFFINIGF